MTLVHRHMAGRSDFKFMEKVVNPINLVQSSLLVCSECPEVMQNKAGEAAGHAFRGPFCPRTLPGTPGREVLSSGTPVGGAFHTCGGFFVLDTVKTVLSRLRWEVMC